MEEPEEKHVGCRRWERGAELYLGKLHMEVVWAA
jgi:hypothetical protein